MSVERPLALPGRAGTIVAGFTALAISACSSGNHRSEPEAEAITPSSKVSMPITASAPSEEGIADGSAVTIARLQAISRVHTPSRAVFEANRHLAQAQVTQARAWANPEAEIEGGRSRTTDGDRLTVGRVSVRQRFEMPNKRSARIDAAEAGITVADSEQFGFFVTLDNDVMENALSLAVLQLGVVQARDIAALAAEVARAVDLRVAAGEANRSDALRSKVDALQADQELKNRELAETAARSALVTLCGGALPAAFTIDIDLEALPATSLEIAQATASERNPELKRQIVANEQRSRVIERERSAATPDVTLGAFAGRETDSRGVGLSLGIDIPVFNRNQGGIAAAEADFDRGIAQLKAERLRVLRDVQSAWYAYDAARSKALRFNRDLRPVAQESLRLALGSYQAGETGLIDLLDARRTAQGIERESLSTLRDAQDARVRLDRATGTSSGNQP